MPNMIESSKLHKSHPDIVKRLKRVEGHVRSIVAMIEEGRPCLDIAQQLYAVEKAVAQAKKTLIHDHIDHCLERVVRNDTQAGRRSMEEFKGISKYL
jgi:uncharacterized protein